MAIPFNNIPATIRVPGVYSEVDNSNAVSGVNRINYRRLLIGGKLTAGTATPNKLVRVTRVSQASGLFGAGSILDGMVRAALAQDAFTELWCMPLADNASSPVKAIGSATFAGTPTVAGTMYLYIAGRLIAFGVAAGAAATAIAGLAITAINAVTSLPVTAAVDGTNAAKVNITAKNAGVTGNDIDIRFNYYADQQLPTGSTVTVVQPTGGAVNPDITTAIAELGDEWFQVMALAYTDSANIVLLETELASRFGPLREIEGHMFTAVRGTLSAVGALGLARNSPHHSMPQSSYELNPPWEKAAETSSIAAQYAAIDPARPLQNVPYKWCLPAHADDRFTLAERNILLYDGVATTKAATDGTMQAERLITTYRQNSSGGDDISYLDVETLFTLMAIRHDWRNYCLQKYPRHKLANDGTLVGAGQPVMTPKIMKSELVTRARLWEELGWVEDIAAFKKNVISERNLSDPNRLDNLIPANLINQLRIIGNKIAFIL